MKWLPLPGKLFLLIAAALLVINFYGEWTTMRIVADIPETTLKFTDDVTIGYDEAITRTKKGDHETDLQFALRINTVIQQSLAHIENWETQPPDLYAQRVPVKENIWLHLAGRISDEPQMQRYHFADYKRTLERGIGLCGDTSTMLSDILWENNIPNSIRAYERHVVVEVRPASGGSHILDADYGAYFNNNSSDNLEDKQQLIYQQYAAAGYDSATSQKLSEILTESYTAYANTFDFMKKRYVLEHILYIVKWLAPLLLLVFGLLPVLLSRKKLSGIYGSRQDQETQAVNSRA